MKIVNEVIYKGCKCVIDPDFCWCGSEIHKHSLSENHSPVEMGCECYMEKRKDKKC